MLRALLCLSLALNPALGQEESTEPPAIVTTTTTTEEVFSQSKQYSDIPQTNK